jgi:hypothetical protein
MRLMALSKHQLRFRALFSHLSDEQFRQMVLHANMRLFRSSDMRWAQTLSAGTVLLVLMLAVQVVLADPEGSCDPVVLIEGANSIMDEVKTSETTARRVLSQMVETLKPYLPEGVLPDDDETDSHSDISDQAQEPQEPREPNSSPFLLASEAQAVQVMLGENPPILAPSATLVPNTDISDDIPPPPPMVPVLRRSRARSRSITQSPAGPVSINVNEALIRSMNGHIRRLHSYWRGMSAMCGTLDDDGVARQLQF